MIDSIEFKAFLMITFRIYSFFRKTRYLKKNSFLQL